MVRAVVGAVVAVLWLAFGTNALVVFVGLTGIGALIGIVLDRPDRLIGLLQRLQDRQPPGTAP